MTRLFVHQQLARPLMATTHILDHFKNLGSILRATPSAADPFQLVVVAISGDGACIWATWGFTYVPHKVFIDLGLILGAYFESFACTEARIFSFWVRLFPTLQGVVV